ncbi:P-II family nitrogen regulator [Burkholderia pseudomallei]|uniref:P-II family nitrogen regulator n=1 Tax=Burkholderia pseudomallei TaxID=28450 RepID=UPI001AAFCA8D|nr:P-II family nitrogen regulator [Burkholderia pseudomallei]MBO3056543.1 P-II family nitrogen regulator [Burkholderia pseudomallei]
MELKCVVAIVRPDVLPVLERRLGAVHVHGMTATRVRGFGAHPNLFADDWTTEHIKIEIFTETETVNAVVKTITDVARKEAGSDGVVAVIPVEKLLRVADASDLSP